jgi:hypothetical protein
MRNVRRSAEGERWHRRRLALFGWPAGRRVRVAAALGISIRTLERYEVAKQGAPLLYELALEGLAAREKVRIIRLEQDGAVVKQEGQPRG